MLIVDKLNTKYNQGLSKKARPNYMLSLRVTLTYKVSDRLTIKELKKIC